MSADQVPHLKLKWAFGFPTGLSAYGQPTIVSGRVFVASDNGYVYSLDAETGCVYWSFEAKAAMRTAISIGPVTGHGDTKFAAYVGDQKANVYAIDAQTGKLLWTRLVDDHITARDPGAPTLADGRLYVPVSTFEEFSASDPLYPCCTFQGSVVALDANTGQRIWKTYTIDEKPKPVKKNSKGTQLWAPSGGSVWNSPTVDRKLHAVYFGTGDGQTDPAPETTDAVMALDAKTGKRIWFHQGTANDSFLGACDDDAPNRSENCPLHQGPDWDFGSSAMLRTLPNGHRLLVAGQKSGTVWAFDPDRNGAIVWSTNVLLPGQKPPSSFGEIVYGGAWMIRMSYFALRSGRVVALALETGKPVWSVPWSESGERYALCRDHRYPRRAFRRRLGWKIESALDHGWPSPLAIRYRSEIQDRQWRAGKGRGDGLSRRDRRGRNGICGIRIRGIYRRSGGQCASRVFRGVAKDPGRVRASETFLLSFRRSFLGDQDILQRVRIVLQFLFTAGKFIVLNDVADYVESGFRRQASGFILRHRALNQSKKIGHGLPFPDIRERVARQRQRLSAAAQVLHVAAAAVRDVLRFAARGLVVRIDTIPNVLGRRRACCSRGSNFAA